MAFDPHHLRLLRTQRNISQEKLAEEIGISRPTYLQIEKGERELTVTEAQKLSGIFGMTLEDFLGGKSPRRWHWSIHYFLYFNTL